MRLTSATSHRERLNGFPRLRAGTFIEATVSDGVITITKAGFPRLRAGTFIEANRNPLCRTSWTFPRLRAGTFIEAY